MGGRRIAVAVAVMALGIAACGRSNSSTGSSKPPGSSTKRGATSQMPLTSARATVSMTDFRFKPQVLSATPGKLRVTAKNDGHAEHEFVLIRTDKARGALPTKGDKASEAGAVGQISPQKPGKKGTHTFKVKPGLYVYICNVPGHYTAGMRGILIVE